MDPQVWGKYQWTSIHFVALGYPNNPTKSQKQHYFTYFSKILPEILPCLMCRQHLKKTLQTEHPMTPLALENPSAMFEWTVSLHNAVNRQLGKSTVTLDEAKRIYMYTDNLHNALCKNVPANQLEHRQTVDSTELSENKAVAEKGGYHVCISVSRTCAITTCVLTAVLIIVMVYLLVHVDKSYISELIGRMRRI